MVGNKKLYDFVRPRTEIENTVWRVVEIKDSKITAEIKANELEPKNVKRVSGNAEFFISLESDAT